MRIDLSALHDSCRLGEAIGSGQFGEVYKGFCKASSFGSEVAVKTLKKGASQEDRVKFLQEAAIMGQFSHSNVVIMYGVVTESEPVSCASFSFRQISLFTKCLEFC